VPAVLLPGMFSFLPSAETSTVKLSLMQYVGKNT